jgi:hypothetical protein
MAGSSVINTPNSTDWIVRRFEELDQWRRELQPSVAKTVKEIAASMVSVAGDTDSNTGFALTSGEWVTVATVDVSGPEWATNAVVTAAGSLFVVANAAFAVPSLRVQIAGTDSMEVELPEGTGASAIPYYGTQTFTRSITGVSSPVTCNLQAYVLDSSKWHAGAPNRLAQLSVTAVFTR